jgi:hypothetical protein
MSFAAFSRRSSDDALLREAIAASDQAIAERRERERAEDEARAERQRAPKAQAQAAQQQAAAARQQAQAEQQQAYGWGDFYKDLDARIASAVDARISAYQEAEGSRADTVREVLDKLPDTKRELASTRDREVRLKERIAALEERVKQPSPLPVVKQWVPNTAALAGEMFAHHGAMWQAKANTGQEPQEGSNWLCVSASGATVSPADSLRTRGLYRKEGVYKELDVVVSNGSSFIAKCDNPGPCPGEGWQVSALVGKRGETGDRGLPGPKADIAALEKALRIGSWEADDDYVVTPTHANGQSGATLNLRPLFEKFFAETR